MWLQLSAVGARRNTACMTFAVVAVALCGPGSTWAEAEPSAGAAQAAVISASAEIAGFCDGSVLVVAPSLDGSIDAGTRGRFRAHTAVDLVSGATRALKSDVVSSATHFREQREDFVVGWRSAAGEAEVGASFAGSSERDFRSLGGRIEGSVEVFGRRTKLDAAIGGSIETMWLPGASPSWRDLVAATLDVSAAQILSRRMVLLVALQLRTHRCDAAVGCQASPYRAVALQWADGDRTSIRERHPAQRLRGAAVTTLSWTPLHGLALHAEGRGSTDDWGVDGASAALAVAMEGFGGASQLRIEGRSAAFMAADFFRRVDVITAAGAPAFRTGDRRLGGMVVTSIGAEVDHRLGALAGLGTVGVTVHAMRQWTDYRGFADALGRRAWVGGLGLRVQP